MFLIPFLYAGLIAFPSAKPCSITLFPADQSDISVTLIEQNLNQLLTVFRFILVNCSHIICRISCCLINIRVVIFADYSEELSQIYLIIVTGLDRRCHFRIG